MLLPTHFHEEPIYNCIVQSSNAGGFIYIEDLDEDYEVNIEEVTDSEYESAIRSNAMFYDTFNAQILNLRMLNGYLIENHELEELHKRLVYTNIVTTMETYLSDALINKVMGNRAYFAKFIETNKYFTEKKIPLSVVLDTYSKMENIVQKELINITYHNLPYVSKIYMDTLNVVFQIILILIVLSLFGMI